MPAAEMLIAKKTAVRKASLIAGPGLLIMVVVAPFDELYLYTQPRSDARH